MDSSLPAEARKKYRSIFNQVEDEQLTSLVARLGRRSWDAVAAYMPGRSARQCRDRWKFYLCPSVNRSPWTPDEDRVLLAKYRELGPKWSILCQSFENRSLNNVKNRWNSVIRKVRASDLDEYSEADFVQCGRLITQQTIGVAARDPDRRRDNRAESAEDFFQITNLLNHPATEIFPPGTLA
jgi:hypothetical protein